MAFILRRVAGDAAVSGESWRKATLKTVDGEALRIGRSADADLSLEDRAVARFHARILPREDGWELVDEGSVTGTYLNGERVTRAPLADGDRVEIGPYRLSVRIEGAAEPVTIEVEELADESQATHQRAGEVEQIQLSDNARHGIATAIEGGPLR